MTEDKLGAGIYPFILEFGDKADFVERSLEILKASKIRNFEIFLDFEEGEKFLFDKAKKTIDAWKMVLLDAGIKVPSVYINLTSHKGLVNKNKAVVREIFQYAKSSFPELEILVVNAVPLDWNDASIQKTQEELEMQVQEFKLLSFILKEFGIKIGYHFHSPELYGEAKEFNFMLENISPEEMGVTLDPNWAIQAGYPLQKMVGDHIERVINIHFRSSHNKIWDEVLENGEEGNISILEMLKQKNYQGNTLVELGTQPGVVYKKSLAQRIDESMNWLRDQINLPA